MKNWMNIFGEIKEVKNGIVFSGKKTDWQPANSSEIKVISELGQALYAEKFTNGKITAEVEFKGIQDEFIYSCLFVFNYSNVNNKSKYISVGISKFMASSVVYREYNGDEYAVNKWYGNSSNIVSNEKYSIEMELVGSTLTFKINDFVIFKNDISANLQSNQIGLFFQSTDEIIVHKFNVESVKRKAFVVMQFEKDYDDLYKGVIEPVCKEFDYEVIRADESFSTGMIIQDIIKRISESSIIIADITPDNPNVFYEVGYSHALKKPTILLNEKNKRDRLPFDVSGFRTIFYDNSIGGKAEVENRFRMFLKNINENIFY